MPPVEDHVKPPQQKGPANPRRSGSPRSAYGTRSSFSQGPLIPGARSIVGCLQRSRFRMNAGMTHGTRTHTHMDMHVHIVGLAAILGNPRHQDVHFNVRGHMRHTPLANPRARGTRTTKICPHSRAHHLGDSTLKSENSSTDRAFSCKSHGTELTTDPRAGDGYIIAYTHCCAHARRPLGVTHAMYVANAAVAG